MAFNIFQGPIYKLKFIKMFEYKEKYIDKTLGFTGALTIYLLRVSRTVTYFLCLNYFTKHIVLEMYPCHCMY